MNALPSFVYTGQCLSQILTASHVHILENTHTKTLATCGQRQIFAFSNFSSGLQDQQGVVWGDRKFATVVVAMEKKKKRFDWQFHLGFGQRFCFDDKSRNHYYCIGFVFGGLSRGKFVLSYEVINGEEELEIVRNKRKRTDRVESGSGMRMYSTNQLVRQDIPKVVGDILSARESTQKAFFAAVQQLFSFGSELPDVTLFEEPLVINFYISKSLYFFPYSS
jgi:hypothetical protein